MNPYEPGASGTVANIPPPMMQRIGTWTLWLSLLVLLLPGILLGIALVWQTFFWDPKTDPGYLEILMWSPMLMIVTTPLAVVGGIIGFVLRRLGRRKATAA